MLLFNILFLSGSSSLLLSLPFPFLFVYLFLFYWFFCLLSWRMHIISIPCNMQYGSAMHHGPRHTCVLRMRLEQSDIVNWCTVVWCTQSMRRDGNSFTWTQPYNNETALYVCTPLWWTFVNALCKASHTFRVTRTIRAQWVCSEAENRAIDVIVKRLGPISRCGAHQVFI